MQHRVVDQVGVAGLAVLAEALAVIGGDRDDRVREAPAALEAREQAAELLVHVGDLAVVGPRREARREGLRRLVGRVRVVVVDPQEERPVGLAQPGRAPASVTSAAGRSKKPAAVARSSRRARRRSGRSPARARTRGRARRRRSPRRSRSPPPGSAPPASRPRSPSTKTALWRTPCVGGYWPVRIEACEGSVSGTAAMACSKSTPRAASASRVRRRSRSFAP